MSIFELAENLILLIQPPGRPLPPRKVEDNSAPPSPRSSLSPKDDDIAKRDDKSRNYKRVHSGSGSDARDDASKKTKTADGRESPAKAVFPIFQTLQKKNGPQKSDNAKA